MSKDRDPAFRLCLVRCLGLTRAAGGSEEFPRPTLVFGDRGFFARSGMSDRPGAKIAIVAALEREVRPW